MKMSRFPFADDRLVEGAGEEHKGVNGTAWWRTQQFGAMRVRRVEYRRATWPTTGA